MGDFTGGAPRAQANPGYAAGQMAKAFLTAAVHEDEQTRRRAAGALEVLEEIGPFADRLRFLPRPSGAPQKASLTQRWTVGQVRERLAARRPSAAVAAMNEALTVWNPFADELLARYRRLAAEHTLCTKHRNPKENLAILRTALQDVLEGRRPSRLLQHAVDSMVAKRARQAGLAVPLVEELAADIFMGSFSAKFRDAALPAADVMEGGLYARYCGIDYAAVRDLADAPLGERFGTRVCEGFTALCRRRAGIRERRWSVPSNGMLIEQAQILTTHNLAALVRPIGLSPSPGRPDPARRAFEGVCRQVGRVFGNPRPLRAVKDAAYAWRQTLFSMSLCTPAEQDALAAWMQEELRRRPAQTIIRLNPVLAGLRHVLAGGDLDDGSAPAARRFLGWQEGGHWMRTGG